MSELPVFRYHPDPVRSGSVVSSEAVCKSCGEARGYIYMGPVYSEHEGLDESLCPWCISDGSAAKKFGASFTDANSIFDEVPDTVRKDVELRTPGYTAWQEPEWRACCNDAAAYIKMVTAQDLKGKEFPGARAALSTKLREEDDMEPEDVKDLIASLGPDSGTSAYLFRCLHCGKFQFHTDFE